MSSDKPVRTYSKKAAIEYHGMLWIFDQLVNHKLLSPQEAAVKLQTLIDSNIIYKSNHEMLNEVEKRIQSWSK